MSNTKGDIYFRDVHGNFHKLETKDLNNELNCPQKPTKQY